MSNLEVLVRTAYERGASDLHLQPGLVPALRINGRLHQLGRDAIEGSMTTAMARQILPGELWSGLMERRSADLSRTIGGVRCRINVMLTFGGVGMAVRVLTNFSATLETLNLHPRFIDFVRRPHGLVILCGPAGSGKSSTIAAMVQEINLAEARHIITIEHPVEHVLRPVKSLIRQREVGRDTPSFDQALIDALREDPDVIVVGEMRRPETMRLTLNVAETGHLVFATMHSSSCVEALHRIVNAFAPESQPGVCAQLADCLAVVICQRLVSRPDLKIRVPECEVLVKNGPVQASISQNKIWRATSAIQTGAADGMWTWDRYRRWLDGRPKFFVPKSTAKERLPPDEPADRLPVMPRQPRPISSSSPSPSRPSPASTGPTSPETTLDGGEDLASILSELEQLADFE
ncbi:MAG: PilT/PilU family type 4a pilus ATPase [Proteobacteria bacterium]|jgi:twitching motility protein PilT|nr:PilT/PilU family type 4a pilus ATPase [Pseudomonadota bacterium]